MHLRISFIQIIEIDYISYSDHLLIVIHFPCSTCPLGVLRPSPSPESTHTHTSFPHESLPVYTSTLPLFPCQFVELSFLRGLLWSLLPQQHWLCQYQNNLNSHLACEGAFVHFTNTKQPLFVNGHKTLVVMWVTNTALLCMWAKSENVLPYRVCLVSLLIDGTGLLIKYCPRPCTENPLALLGHLNWGNCSLILLWISQDRNYSRLSLQKILFSFSSITFELLGCQWMDSCSPDQKYINNQTVPFLNA